MSRRSKGRVLEDLTQSVIKSIGLNFEKEYKNPNANKKGQRYCDHKNEYCQIEDKYWSCKEKRYRIDAYMAYKQIISRFDYNTPLKILIIADPIWTQNARELIEFHGITVIQLNMDKIEEKYSEAYWLLRSKLVELYCLKGTRESPFDLSKREMGEDRWTIPKDLLVYDGIYDGIPLWRYRQLLYDPSYLEKLLIRDRDDWYLEGYESLCST